MEANGSGSILLLLGCVLLVLSVTIEVNDAYRYMAWSGWTGCSRWCGGGMKYKYRYCQKGQECRPHLDQQGTACNTHTCPGCFPAMAKVTLESGSHVTMADLKTGDRVLTVSEDGKIMSSDVRVFLQRDPDDIGLYTRLTAEDGHEIVLTPNHIIYTSKMNNTGIEPRFASTVEMGDYIFTPGGEGGELRALRVTGVTSKVAMEGVYAPLTAHGTLLVDDIYASCYASIQHDWAHAALTPIRWFPTVCTLSSDQNGTPAFVRLVKALGRSVLPYGIQNKNPLAIEAFTIS